MPLKVNPSQVVEEIDINGKKMDSPVNAARLIPLVEYSGAGIFYCAVLLGFSAKNPIETAAPTTTRTIAISIHKPVVELETEAATV